MIDRPNLIGSYNKFMGGVDRLDAMIAANRITAKSKKWWWNHYTNMMRVQVSAAFYIWKIVNPASTLDMLAFTRQIVVAYIGTSNKKITKYPRKKNDGLRVPDCLRLQGRGHYPEACPLSRCAWPTCSRRVRVQCKICLVGLCFDTSENHFERFHSVKVCFLSIPYF